MKMLPWICCSLVVFAAPLVADELKVVITDPAKPMGIEVIEEEGERHTFFKGAGPKDGKIKSIEIQENGQWKYRKMVDYDDAGRLEWEMEEDGFTTVYVRDANGKLVGKKVLPPRDPKILQALKAKEEKLLKEIADAPEGKEKEKRWAALGSFYVGQMRDSAKALTVVPHLTDRKEIFSVKGSAVNHDRARTYAQKIEGYKELLIEFPEQRGLLESSIVQTQENIDAGRE